MYIVKKFTKSMKWSRLGLLLNLYEAAGGLEAAHKNHDVYLINLFLECTFKIKIIFRLLKVVLVQSFVKNINVFL